MSKITTEQLKSELDIAEVLSHYGAKENGGNSNWSCPFHTSENGISLVVDREKGLAWCCSPGCGFGGDIFNVIATGEKLDIKTQFQEILQKAAEMAGYDINEIENKKSLISKEQVLKSFVGFSQKYIGDISDYIIEKRKISKEDISQLGLGYIPPERYSECKQHILKECPFVNNFVYTDSKDNVKKMIDTFFAFKGRIIHPHYIGKKLVYLTGERTPNTPEIFSKNKYHKLNVKFSPSEKSEAYHVNSLYSESKEIVISEGYWDALTLSLLGISTVTYGTCKVPKNFVSDYKERLKQKKIILCFDQEDNLAGTEGLLSLGNQMLNQGITNLFVAELSKEGTDKIDIDEAFKPINNETKKMAQDFFNKAIPFVDFRKKHLAEYAHFNYSTEHLPGFNEFNNIIALHGEEYIPTTKITYLSILGNSLKDTPIEIGSIYDDTKMNIAYVFPSGTGKGNYKHGFSEVYKGYTSEIMSLHPEQLVGKVVQVNKKNKESKGSTKVYEDRYGYFAENILLMDEARPFLTGEESKDHEFVRQYFCKALDPVGRNLITKRTTELGAKHELSYFAKCSLYIFTQPAIFSGNLTDGGFSRRFFWLKKKSNDDPKEVYNNRFNFEKGSENDLLTIQEIINKLKQRNKNWDIEEEAKNLMGTLAGYVYDFSISHSDKGARYVKTVLQQPLFNYLLKLAAIHSAVESEDKIITTKHVKLAYCDLLEIMQLTLDCVRDHFNDDFNSSDLKSDSQKIIEFISEEGAAEETTSELTKEALIDFISFTFALTESGAGKRYESLKKKKLIDSKQVGQYSSKVFLTNKGKRALEQIIRKRPSKSQWYLTYQSIQCEMGVSQ